MNSKWKRVLLSDICSQISDGTHHSPEVQFAEPGEGRFKYVTSKNLRPWGLDLTNITYVTEDVHREIYKRCKPELGDVLLTKDGANTGMVAINTLDEQFSLLSSVALLKPDRGILEPRYLRYFLESPEGSKRIVGRMTGTAIRRIILKQIKDAEIPLAPLPEQRGIVAEIEKQFTRLDAGVSALKRVQANLKRYCAAVLKAACEGKLVPTEAEFCKKNGTPDFESGAALLQRILTERRKSWKGKGKFKEPASPITANLPLVPAGWAYATIEQLGKMDEQAVLTGPFGTNLGREDFKDSGIPVLTISCLKNDGIKLDKAEHISEEKARDLEKYRLGSGDLLFSRMASVGRAGIVGDSLTGALFNYHIMRLRLEPTALLAKFYLAYVRGSSQVETYLREVNHGATRAGINTEQLLNMPVALPPFAEQARIVAEVERRLSVIDELEAAVTANLQRTSRLRQSILKKAFSGELIPQKAII